jgi:hypothetical protein
MKGLFSAQFVLEKIYSVLGKNDTEIKLKLKA